MFSSLWRSQFLLVHYSYWFNPWSLRAKVKDSENYLRRPTWAKRRHASSIWIREEAKVFFRRHTASLSSRCALPATDGAHSHWMRVAQVFVADTIFFAVSFLSSRYALLWTDETRHALVSSDSQVAQPQVFLGANTFFPQDSPSSRCALLHKNVTQPNLWL